MICEICHEYDMKNRVDAWQHLQSTHPEEFKDMMIASMGDEDAAYRLARKGIGKEPPIEEFLE